MPKTKIQFGLSLNAIVTGDRQLKAVKQVLTVLCGIVSASSSALGCVPIRLAIRRPEL
jgi:hypothetical protein